jgi:formylglycine-generating enzyme required for sulfatase activity
MFPRTDEHPVVQVDYQAAVAFCEWLAEETDLPIRLPKESEWQWAAGAGEGGRTYGGEITDYANVADASLARHFITGSMVRGDDGYAFTAPVKSLKPNKWNLYDMYGNVWELCGDYYGQQLKSCVLRGGSWNFGAESSRYDARCYYSPVSRDDNVGFRPIVRL